MTVYNYVCNDTVVNCWLQNDPAEGPAHIRIYLYTYIEHTCLPRPHMRSSQMAQ